MQQRVGSQRKTKIKAIWTTPSISAVVMSQICLYWGRGVSHGFLQGWRTGSLAWGLRSPGHPAFLFFFSLSKKRPWSSFQGQNRIFFSRSRWGGRGEFLATGEEEGRGAGGESNSLLVCCTDTGSSKQCVWMLYCTVLRNSRDRWPGGYWLLTVVIWVVKRCLLYGPALKHRAQWQCSSGSSADTQGGREASSRSPEIQLEKEQETNRQTHMRTEK